MTGVDNFRDCYPEAFDSMPPLLEAMDRRLADSLEGSQKDPDFRGKLLSYVELVIDRASPGPEEALRLLDDLIRAESAGELCRRGCPDTSRRPRENPPYGTAPNAAQKIYADADDWDDFKSFLENPPCSPL